jgi:hypothetical protein
MSFINLFNAPPTVKNQAYSDNVGGWVNFGAFLNAYALKNFNDPSSELLLRYQAFLLGTSISQQYGTSTGSTFNQLNSIITPSLQAIISAPTQPNTDYIANIATNLAQAGDQLVPTKQIQASLTALFAAANVVAQKKDAQSQAVLSSTALQLGQIVNTSIYGPYVNVSYATTPLVVPPSITLSTLQQASATMVTPPPSGS